MSALSALAARLPPRTFIRLVALQYRLFEPELAHLAEFVPAEKAAVDVGAWWGPWSWWLARRARQVHTFEPNPAIAEALRSGLPPNVTVHSVAASDHAGEEVLWSPSGGRGTEGRSTLVAGDHGDWVSHRVETVPLDDLALNDIGFVKIDVEGHELSVLKGARALLARERPNLLVEVEQAHSGEDNMTSVFALLADLGYTGFFLRRGRWSQLEEFDRDEARRLGELQKSRGLLRSTISGHGYVHNFLFRPGA